MPDPPMMKRVISRLATTVSVIAALVVILPGTGVTAMQVFSEVRHVSVSVHFPPDDVYVFAANPANLPRGAKGLSRTESRWLYGYRR